MGAERLGQTHTMTHSHTLTVPSGSHRTLFRRFAGALLAQSTSSVVSRAGVGETSRACSRASSIQDYGKILQRSCPGKRGAAADHHTKT